jgi:hypothetical protein
MSKIYYKEDNWGHHIPTNLKGYILYKLEDFWERWCRTTFGVVVNILVVILLGMCFVFSLIGGFSYIVEKNKCNQLQEIDSVHIYNHGFWTGCLVKTEQGFWINPRDIGNGEFNLHVKDEK